MIVAIASNASEAGSMRASIRARARREGERNEVKKSIRVDWQRKRALIKATHNRASEFTEEREDKSALLCVAGG